MKIQGEEIVLKSTALRGMFKFDEAIELIASNIDKIHPDIHLNAWREAFLAACEKGDNTQAKKYALEIARHDPNLPSIQSYL